MADTHEPEAEASPLRWVVGIGVGLLVVVSVLGYVVAASLQQLKPAPYAILPPATGAETVASVPATMVVPATSEAAILKPAAASSGLSSSPVGPVAVVALPPAGVPLVRTLQERLSAAGCYDGATNGYWTTRTREAMARFVAAVDARLPVKQPDPVLLALIESNADVRCGSDPADRPKLAVEARQESGARAVVTVAAAATTDDEEPAAVASVTTLDDSDDEAPSEASTTAAGTPSGSVAGAAALAAGAVAAGTSAAAAGSSRKRSTPVAEDDDDDDEDAQPARSSRASRSNASRGSSGSERSYRSRRQPDVLRGMKTVSRQMSRNMRSVGRSLSRLIR